MHDISRRTFLKFTALGSAGCAWSATPNPAERTQSPQPSPPGAWQKHGIVLQADEPWEGKDIQNFACGSEPLENGAWKLWYSVSDASKGYRLAYAVGRPGEPMRKTVAECSPSKAPDAPFALGHLPLKWNPVQGVHLHLRNGKHRLYFWAHGPQICRYLAAESDDGRRYQVLDPLRPILYHPNDRAARGVASPDGSTTGKPNSNKGPAEEPIAASNLISNDATNVYQLPNGSFEMYSVGLIRVSAEDPAYVAEDNAPGCLRVIDRYVSEDGLHFQARQRIISRDARDPVDQQFYYLAVTAIPSGKIGLLGHYRCREQTMDLEWCFSADGIHWERSWRTPWLKRGEAPDPDCFGIYAGHSLVRHAGRWHLFYTGVNSSHNGKHSNGNPRQVIMYATTDAISA